MTYALTIIGALLIGLLTASWNWLPAVAFVTLMLIAYAFLFRKPKGNL